jgi:hypothetical protein
MTRLLKQEKTQMKFKTLLVVSAMALSIAGIASAKSWDITLNETTTVGTNQLKAGDYEVKLDGNQAIVTDEAHGKAVKVAVTVEHNAKKFADTEVETVNKDGKDMVHSISLGGSNTKLVLN